MYSYFRYISYYQLTKRLKTKQQSARTIITYTVYFLSLNTGTSTVNDALSRFYSSKICAFYLN